MADSPERERAKRAGELHPPAAQDRSRFKGRIQIIGLAAVVRQDGNGVLRVDSASRFMRAYEAPEPDERERDDDETEGNAYFQIWRLDGSTIARSESLTGTDLPFSAAAADTPQLANVTLPRGTAVRTAWLRFRPTPTDRATELLRPEPVVLGVATSRQELDRTIETVVVGLAGCCLLVIVVTFLMVPRVVTGELRPIDALADQATHITAESLHTRFAVDGLPTELSPIAGRLNDLLGRLEESFERERRFSADLAHELRTPIAELVSAAEVSLTWSCWRILVLRSILTNLLQNAVDYATPGGHVDATMTAGGDVWDLCIANDVTGLNEQDVARLFDRFWRHDAARSGGLHAGLGLSLARSLAALIGADLTAQLEAPTRLVLTLRGLQNATNDRGGRAQSSLI